MKARVSILFLLIPQICFGTVYHVGPGEIYTTFAAFHAAVTPAAGDVVDGGGNTFFEEIAVNCNGTDGFPVTYQNFRVIGASVLDNWIGPDGNSEYYTATPVDVAGGNNVDIVIKNGIIVNRAADNSFGSLSEGYWVKDTVNNRIYYKPDDGMAHVFEAGRGNLIGIAGHDYIRVSSCTIYGGTNGIQSTTTSQDKVLGLEIDSCTISNFCAHAIQIYSSDGSKIENNIISYCQKGGVKLGGLLAAVNVAGDNAVVNSNRFYRNGWAHVSYDSEEHVIDIMPFSVSPVISKNIISESGYIGGQVYTDVLSAGTCISVDGVDDFEISGNHLFDNYNGCIVFGPDTNYAGTMGLISRNVFNHNGLAAVDSGSRSNKLRVICSKNDIGAACNAAVSILNNTFCNNRGSVGTFNNGAANIFLSGGSDMSGLVIKNNLHFENVNKADFRVYSENGAITYIEDNNLYYRSGGGDFLAIGGLATTTAYPETNNFAAFMTATGSTNDINADPLLVSSTDFHLTESSPARSAASGGGDIGAHEYKDLSAPGAPNGVNVK